MSFDAIGFFRDFGIRYRETGPGTSRGWVQIQCPFCYDHSWHLGVKPSKEHFHCWVCHKAGPIPPLIYKLLGVSFEQAKAIAKEYGYIGFSFEQESDTPRAEKVEIKGMTTLKPMHISYLQERGFDPLYLQRMYGIKAGYTIGRFPYRVIIPVFDDHRFVNATARDVTGKQSERYLSLRDEEGVIPIKNCVYNIDRAKESILIVEGPFDVWRIGGSCVSLFGTAFKMAQVSRILSKFPENVYILFDKETEAQKNASKLASCFAPLVKHVEIMGIPVKDPALLTPQQAEEIRNELKI